MHLQIIVHFKEGHMGNMSKKTRNSNLEILRIISMVLIVAHHYSVHGFGTIELTYSFNRYLVGFLSLGGKLGVSCFVLISGYFMVNSKFTLGKLIKLVAETLFYSVGIGILFLTVLTPVKSLGIRDSRNCLLPIGYSYYWFMTDFIILMLISPALNIIVSNVSKEMHRNFLLGATVLWSIIPSLISASYGYTELGWFIVLYLYAGYIRKYINIDKQNGVRHLGVAVVSYFLVIASNIFLIYLGHVTSIEAFTNQSTRFMALNSPLILITSVELLVGFASLKPRYSKKINKLASATLGVYLIHDNPLFRPYLWRVILKNPEMYSSNLLIIHAMISIIGVYVVCSCIDLIRQYTVERVFMGIVNKKLEDMLDKKDSTLDDMNKKAV
jgi:surface polysaccharide O-acyltransferase-like enzyme